MGIMEDILNGVQDVASGVNDVTGGIAGDVVRTGARILDTPRQVVTAGIGAATFADEWARHQMGLTGDERYNEVAGSFLGEDGFQLSDLYHGGREVWEDDIVSQFDSPISRGLIDIGIDPLTYAGGIGLIGRGIRTGADTATALGKAQKGFGAAIEGAGTVMKMPDVATEAAFRGVGNMGRATAFSPLGRKTVLPAYRQIDRKILAPSMRTGRTIADFSRDRWSKSRFADLTSLAPLDKYNAEIRRPTLDAVNNALAGEQGFGRNALNMGGRQARRDLYNDQAPGVLAYDPAYNDPLVKRSRDMRNNAYESSISRDVLDTWFEQEGTVPLWRGSPDATDLAQGNRNPRGFTTIKDTSGRGRQKLTGADAHHKRITDAITKYQSSKMPASSPLFDRNQMGIAKVQGATGPVSVFESTQEYDDLAREASRMILAEAQLNEGFSSVEFALNDLQRIQREFQAQYPDVDQPMWVAIYDEVKRLAKEEEGIDLPSTVYAGDYPGGGGFDARAEGVTPEARKDYASNVAAAMFQVLREGGAAADFVPGKGTYAKNGDTLSKLAHRGGVGRGGLKLASPDEFAAAWSRQYGQANPDELAEFYEIGLNRFRETAVRSATGRFEKLQANLSVDDARKIANDQYRADKGPKLMQEKAGTAFEIWRQGLPLSGDEMKKLVELGMPGRTFYSDHILQMRTLFDSDEDFDAFLDLLVVTSPHTAVRPNVTKAMNAWVDWKANRPEALAQAGYDPAFIDNLGYSDDDVSGFFMQEGLDTHREGIQRVMDGTLIETPKLTSYRGSFRQQAKYADLVEAYRGTPLEGRAPEAYRRSMGTVTNDMWNQVANYLPLSPSGNDYQIMESAGRLFADMTYNEYRLTPDEVQAVVWAGEKARFGYKLNDTYGTDESPMKMVVDDLAGRTPLSKASGARGGNATGKNFDNMMAFVQNGGAQSRVERFVRDSEVALREGAKGGTAWFQPSLAKIAPGKAAELARQPKLHVVSHQIPVAPRREMAKDLMKFKLNADIAATSDWTNMRYTVNYDPDGNALVDLWYLPPEGAKGVAKVADERMMRSLQNRRDRALEAAGDYDTKTQFRVMREVMDYVREGNDLSTGLRATNSPVKVSEKSKPGGNVKLGIKDSTPRVIGQQTEQILRERADDAEFYGGSYKFTGKGLVEIPEEEMANFRFGGYPVSLSSAGKGGKIVAGQNVQAEVEKTLKALAPVLNGPNGDLLYAGLFKDESVPGGWTFDINISAKTAEEAEAIGALTNQIAYWDPYNFESVDLKRGTRDSNSPFKTAEEVEDLLNLIVESRRDGVSLEQAANHRGWLIAEDEAAGGVGITPGTRNKLGLAPARKSGEPMWQYLKRALVDTEATGDGEIIARAIKETGPYRRVSRSLDAMTAKPTEAELAQTDAFKEGLQFNIQEMQPYENAGRKPWLSEEENNLLYGTVFKSGESVGEYTDRIAGELRREQEMLAGIKWDETFATAASKASLTDDPELQAVIRKWHKLGINPQNPAEYNVATVVDNKMREEMAPNQGVEKRTWYDKAKAVWSETALASLRYPAANVVTNIMDAMITGHWKFDSPLSMFKYAAADLKDAPIEQFYAGTVLDEVLSKYGLGMQSTIVRPGFRDNLGGGRKSQTRAVLDRFGVGKLARVVEAPLALALGSDISAKSAVYADVLESTFEQGVPELLGKLTRITDNARFDSTGLDLLPSYDPAYVYGYYLEMGIPEGYAQAMSRQVAELRNKASKSAGAEVDRIYLTYDKTNLDNMAAKFVPFHYWATRKVRFYAEEAMRNPALMAGYLRAVEGLEKAHEDGGLSGRQKGFLALMGGPTGFTLLMNPEAMMGVIKASGLADQYTPEGETEIGAIVRRLKKFGVGLYPWVDGAINMMGTYGDTFEPDMLGIRHRALVGSVVNWMRGEGFIGEPTPGASPYTDLSLEAREKLSSWASTFAPDWLSQPVLVKEGGSPGQISMEQTIQSRVMAENPGLTNAELVAIMSDPESEEYKSAFRDAARAGVTAQVLSFSLPMSFRVDENTRDVRTAQRQLISQRADEMGLMPWEVTQGNVDAEFRATYKDATGNEFRVTDWETTGLKNELASAAPQGRPLVVWENEYQAIANEIAPGVSQTYYAIRNGTQVPPGISKAQVQSFTPEQLQMLADQWLDSSGQRQNFELARQMQDAYAATHPEFAQFRNWRSDMYDLQAIYGGSLQEYRRVATEQNPYFAAYMADRMYYHQQVRGLRGQQLAAALDQDSVSTNAFYALAGQPMTINDPAAGDAGLGDPSQAMSQPWMTSSGYTDPNALMPEDPMMQEMLAGQQLQTQSGPMGYIGEMPAQPPAPIDWRAEAQRRRY